MSKFKDNQKQFIIREAARLFVDRGIENVTMSDVAREIGVGEATLYRYFGKKETIVCLAGAYIWQLHLNKYFLEPEESGYPFTGYELIERFYKSFYFVYKDDTKYLNFILNFDSYVARRQILPEDLEPYDEKLAEIRKEYDKAFKKGVEDGSIRADIDKEVFYYATTRALLSTVSKLSKTAILASDSFVSPLYQIEILIDIITKYVKRY